MDPNYNQPIAPAPPPSIPPPTPGGPASYSDVIAQNDAKKGFFSGKMLVVIIGAVVALIAVIIIGIVANNIRQSSLNEVKVLSTELDDLQAILRYSQANPISNSNTIKVVAETNLIAMSRQKDLAGVYTAISDTSSAPFETSDTASLNDAKALGNLDAVYTATLRAQLVNVCSKLEAMYDSATAAQRSALGEAYQDFQELANRLPVTEN
jgi:hypothetical protein